MTGIKVILKDPIEGFEEEAEIRGVGLGEYYLPLYAEEPCPKVSDSVPKGSRLVLTKIDLVARGMEEFESVLTGGDPRNSFTPYWGSFDDIRKAHKSLLEELHNKERS